MWIFLADFPPFKSLSDHFISLGIYLAALDSKDVDVIYQAQQAFKHFVETGQVWALLIGFALGYMFKSFTTY